MQNYIVRQPIYDNKQTTWAYEIIYSDASGAFGESPAMEKFFLDYATSHKAEEARVFITFTASMLQHKVADFFAPETLIVQIDESVLLMSDAMDTVGELRSQGYQIASVGFSFSPHRMAAMNKLDYIKLDFSSNDASYVSIGEIAHKLGKSIVAYNVNNANAFAYARACGADYMQGSFIAALQPRIVHSADHLPASFAQLLVAVSVDDPDYEELEKIISRDVGLTYSILKLVNSAYFSPRSRISSIRQALSFLGVKQLKEWVYLLGFQSGANLPLEYMKLSLLRAKFCSALQPLVPDIGITASEAYLIGLLSTLDVLVNAPLEQVLADVDVSDAIRNALLHHAGLPGALYQFVLCYENADWHHMGRYADTLSINVDNVGALYFQCVDEVNTLWEGISSMGGGR
ncbi:MAG: HDOD domain-containing protein [Clostridia bacterium]|nr:HDOD domain-containing protein [Clostridia bacterium]